MAYQERIRIETARMGFVGIDPRHVEAFLRDSRGTLDAMSATEFRLEIKDSIDCINSGGVDFAECLAQSYGL